MSELDFGTVPAWISSILSGASLLLALFILLGDRRQRAREEANKIACWIEGPPAVTDWRLHILNASDRPITNVEITWTMGRRLPHVARKVVRPDEEIEIPLPLVEIKESVRRALPPIIQFSDVAGQDWARDLWTDRLIRRRLSFSFKYLGRRQAARYWRSQIVDVAGDAN